MMTPEKALVKAQVAKGTVLLVGLLAGALTVLLTSVMGVLPAIVIGGIAFGLVGRLVLALHTKPEQRKP